MLFMSKFFNQRRRPDSGLMVFCLDKGQHFSPVLLLIIRLAGHAKQCFVFLNGIFKKWAVNGNDNNDNDNDNDNNNNKEHYIDVIMTTMASQITRLAVVYSTVYSDADQRKHQSSVSLAFVWEIHRDRWIPRTKGHLRGKCFHLMTSSWENMPYPDAATITL